MTVCLYRDIHTLQPYIIDFTQRGCHTLRLFKSFSSLWRSIRSIFLNFDINAQRQNRHRGESPAINTRWLAVCEV